MVDIRKTRQGKCMALRAELSREVPKNRVEATPNCPIKKHVALRALRDPVSGLGGPMPMLSWCQLLCARAR